MFKSIRITIQYVCLFWAICHWVGSGPILINLSLPRNLSQSELHSFNERLYHWYHLHQRDLPWRSETDPYLIWVSETILQQTRVAQGLDYYKRFVARFPNVISLAEAHEDELLKVWEGLGYYSRARNMHTAAQTIVSIHHGVFPDKYDDILNLKGVGEYTAAAVASIAFGLPRAVVDGNVSRVMARYFGINDAINVAAGHKSVRQAADDLLQSAENRIHPGIHNQAVMELGALVCTPANPSCAICPVADGCYANMNNMVGSLPVKIRNLKRMVRHFCFLVIEDNGSFYLEKRTSQGIWKNLYQFPLVETESAMTVEEVLTLPEVKELVSGPDSAIVNVSDIYKHVLTHRDILARFVYVQVSDCQLSGQNFFKVNKQEISNFAFPVLITNYLRKSGFLTDGR